MMVNGREWLACEKRISDLASMGPIQVAPLQHFPVIRDLVIDMTDFLEKLEKTRPWLIRDKGTFPEEEFRQKPVQLETYKQYSMCINCMLCFSACPVYGIDATFAGPATIALAQRWNMDSRDQGKSFRTGILSQHDGIWDCVVIGECSVVCPKNVDPVLGYTAIQTHRNQGVVLGLSTAANGEIAALSEVYGHEHATTIQSSDHTAMNPSVLHFLRNPPNFLLDETVRRCRSES